MRVFYPPTISAWEPQDCRTRITSSKSITCRLPRSRTSELPRALKKGLNDEIYGECVGPPCCVGEKNCWLEIILDEGKNRHIRRMLEGPMSKFFA